MATKSEPVQSSKGSTSESSKGSTSDGELRYGAGGTSPRGWVLALVSLLDILVYLAGVWLSYRNHLFVTGHAIKQGRATPLYIGPGSVQVSLVAIGVITFVGFYYYESDMKKALTASAWLTYLALLASFLNRAIQHRLSADGVTNTMIITLTTLVGAISAFYFHSEYSAAREARTDHREKPPAESQT